MNEKESESRIKINDFRYQGHPILGIYSDRGLNLSELALDESLSEFLIDRSGLLLNFTEVHVQEEAL